MTEFRYTVREHDLAKPWLVVGDAQHLTVELDNVGEFSAWVAQNWPRDRYTAQLDPGQEKQRLKR